MKICLDTNVLISGIFWKGIPGKIVEFWTDGKFDLVASLPMLDEYKRVLHRMGQKLESDLPDKWIKILIEKLSIVVTNETQKSWSRDASDDKFIRCCLTGEADFLVTGDKDLLVLAGKLPFKILKPRKFLEVIK